ncbi:MAG: VF530 family protein [Spirochaetaceae bacterium]|jgi:uncharacterized protein (DUF2132 family)|nr:VF530 family protein [Spirochaetaceae bacterium]
MINSKDPLHGITLKTILERLVQYFGWEKLGSHITIKCFNSDPSIQSSLKFLRRTEWARKKVEDLYLDLDYAKKDEYWWERGKNPRE